MAKSAFDKFINKPVSGAKKKEIIRQEKKKAKRELREAIEESKRRKRLQMEGQPQQSSDRKQFSDFKNKKGKGRDEKFSSSPKKDFRKKEEKDFRGGERKIVLKKANKYVKDDEIKPQKKNFTTDRKQKESHQPISSKQDAIVTSSNELMPLNKYIAHCGVCGRREAADIVKSGKVKVNNEIIFEPGFKVTGNEKILVNGKAVHLQKNLVYILLNKPKDYITTVTDPEGRKTVLDLVKGANTERLYPVGRLDRNTTGVLLVTNDGQLAQKLTHPSYNVKKIYEVTLDKPLTKNDFEAIINGVTLEDGFIAADSVAYADAKDRRVIGIEIHSGRNRIVRRMFEHLGYDVKNLDRVMFANLTKKNVDRGKWRYLSEKEIRLLKYLNQGVANRKGK